MALEAVYTHSVGAPVISRRFTIDFQVASWSLFLCLCLLFSILSSNATCHCCCSRFSILIFLLYLPSMGFTFLVCYLFCHQLSISGLLNKNGGSLIDTESQSMYFFPFLQRTDPMLGDSVKSLGLGVWLFCLPGHIPWT